MTHEPAPRLLGPTRRGVLAFGLGAPWLARAGAAQQPTATEDPAAVLDPGVATAIDAEAEVQRRLVGDALESGACFQRLARLVAAAPKRLSGSPGLAAALEWARQECQALGADRVALEPVRVPHWERGAAQAVRVVGPAHAAGEVLPSLALGGSDATVAGGIAAEVIAVRSFEELSARAAEAAGKIVFFARPFDPRAVSTGAAYGGAVDQRTRGAIEAAKAGAVAAIVRSMGPAVDDWPHTGAMSYQAGVPRIPAAAISTRAAERLSALLARGEPVQLFFEQDCRWHAEPAESANLVADWTGREKPDEVVLVGGHLDGWDVADGAHDDGAGCAHALEVAALFRGLGKRPRRTLRVVLFTNEENGLAGAREYARAHQAEVANHVLALESDSGGFVPRGFTTNAAPASRLWLQRIASHLAFAGAGAMDEGYGGADIGPLAPAGVPLVGFRPDNQRYFDVHHTANDVLANVHPRELCLGAGVIAALSWTVCELEARLPRNG